MALGQEIRVLKAFSYTPLGYKSHTEKYEALLSNLAALSTRFLKRSFGTRSDQDRQLPNIKGKNLMTNLVALTTCHDADQPPSEHAVYQRSLGTSTILCN